MLKEVSVSVLREDLSISHANLVVRTGIHPTCWRKNWRADPEAWSGESQGLEPGVRIEPKGRVGAMVRRQASGQGQESRNQDFKGRQGLGME